MESAEITAPFMRFASATAASLLPEAVGPAMIRSGGFVLLFCVILLSCSDERPDHRILLNFLSMSYCEKTIIVGRP